MAFMNGIEAVGKHAGAKRANDRRRTTQRKYVHEVEDVPLYRLIQTPGHVKQLLCSFARAWRSTNMHVNKVKCYIGSRKRTKHLDTRPRLSPMIYDGST